MPARRRRRVLTVLLVLLVLIAAALVAGYWWQRPLLLTATGYPASNECAVRHVADRTEARDDLPPNPLVPHLRTSEARDVDGARVDATVRGLLAEQTAWYADGFGCTLAESRPELPAATEVSQGHRWTDLPLADPAAAGPEVEAAISQAFGDDLDETDREELGTRAVVVLHDGRLVAERYADGFGPETPQLGWSMAKSVTNLMVGALVARGDVSLDDDGLRAEWTDARADITVEDLLRMTSGLEWDETYELGTPITRMLYLEPDMASYVAGQPAEHEPGTYQGVLQRQHQPVVRRRGRQGRRHRRGTRRPASRAPVRAARPDLGGLGAGCLRQPGVQLLPLGHSPGLGGGSASSRSRAGSGTASRSCPTAGWRTRRPTAPSPTARRRATPPGGGPAARRAAPSWTGTLLPADAYEARGSRRAAGDRGPLGRPRCGQARVHPGAGRHRHQPAGRGSRPGLRHRPGCRAETMSSGRGRRAGRSARHPWTGRVDHSGR